MEASDVMTTNVITIGPDTEVKEIIKTLLDNHLNGVPVVDAEQRVIGVVMRETWCAGSTKQGAGRGGGGRSTPAPTLRATTSSPTAARHWRS